MAWLASLPLALAIPAALWTIAFASSGDILRFFEFCVFVVLVSIGVHLASYLLTGLPIFLWLFGKPGAAIWRLPVGLAVGALLGAMVPALMWLLAEGDMDSASLVPSVVCAGYGAVTAVAAYQQRPKEQMT